MRRLAANPIPEAVTALDALRREGHALIERSKLIGLYRKNGYHGAARFFENSVRVAQREPLDFSPVATPVMWSDRDGEPTTRDDAVAEKVARLNDDQKFTEAVDLAQQEMKSRGSRVHLVMEWADAVLLKTVMNRFAKGPAVSSEDFEAAQRILLTALPERVRGPSYKRSPADRYSILSHLLSSYGDCDSALTASLMAIHAARNPTSFLDDPPPIVKRELCADVSRLKKEQGLPERLWSEEIEPVCTAGAGN